MINVTLGEVKTQEEKRFPKVMKSTDYGELVYFLEPEKGVMLTYSGKGSDLRKVFHTGYKMKYFQDFDAPITIQNA